MRPLHEWPMPGSLIATIFIVRGAIALFCDFKRWQKGLDVEMERRGAEPFEPDAAYVERFVPPVVKRRLL